MSILNELPSYDGYIAVLATNFDVNFVLSGVNFHVVVVYQLAFLLDQFLSYLIL